MSWLKVRVPVPRASANSRRVRTAPAHVRGPPRWAERRTSPPRCGPGVCAQADASRPSCTATKKRSTACVAAVRETSSSLLTVPLLHPQAMSAAVAHSDSGRRTVLAQLHAVHLDEPGAVRDLADAGAAGVVALEERDGVAGSLGGHGADEADAHVEDLPQLGARDIAEAGGELADRRDREWFIDAPADRVAEACQVQEPAAGDVGQAVD